MREYLSALCRGWNVRQVLAVSEGYDLARCHAYSDSVSPACRCWRRSRITVRGMIPDIHIVFDCADPDRLARFWMVALPGYDFPHGPPDGFPTWQEWADANDIPEEQRNAGRTLVDRQGHRPDIFFLRVPESKNTKNRVHLDVKASDPLPDAERRARIEAVGNELVAAGGSIYRRVDNEEGFWLVMQDPEGNEFCVN
jgi:hypothetical protein